MNAFQRGLGAPQSPPKKRQTKPKPISTRQSIRPAPPKRRPAPKTQSEIDLSRHRRRCTVCHHPDREAIEEAFLDWRSVNRINCEFDVEGGCSAIYRHAHALNLFKKRQLTLRSALEYIIEEAENITPTAEGLVKAIRAYTRINDRGEWIDTPTTHIVQVMAVPAGAPNPGNPTQGLALDIRKERSQIVYSDARTLESAASQALLTETTPHSGTDLNP